MATTKTSIRLINTEKNNDAGANQTLLKINISDIKLNIIICPAEIFANNLIIRDIGLINIPKNSIGARNNFIGTGIPGIQNMCFQYVFLPLKLVMINVIRAKAKVMAIFPVTLIPKGVKPKRLRNQMKKNKVNK